MKPHLLIVGAILCLSLPAFAQTEEKANQQPEKTEQKTNQQTKQEAEPVNLSMKTIEGRKIHGEAPVYPLTAKLKRIQGDVILFATIDTQGHISGLKLVEGHPVLAQAAIEAVRKWRYQPYMLEGIPVRVETKIKVSF